MKRTEFTKEMRKTHTIYIPNMLPYHNDLLRAAFCFAGYKMAVVPEYPQVSSKTAQLVNSSYCTCASDIVGSLLAMLENPAYAKEKIAFLEPQMTSSCRAGNYYNLILDCLSHVGRSDIPVLSLNFHGQEKHSGFSVNLRFIAGGLAAVCYGDLLMTLLLQTRPYEKEKGSADAVYRRWLNFLEKEIASGRSLLFRKSVYRKIISEFRSIPLDTSLVGTKKKVGIVGEIYIKCSPVGNQHLEEFLDEQGCEHRMVGFLSYCIYSVYAEMVSDRLSAKNRIPRFLYKAALAILCRIQLQINRVLQDGGFCPDGDFSAMLHQARDIIHDSYVSGDGWLVCGEITDNIQNGYDRILTVHPFGCLVSHVAERGILQELHIRFPTAKIHDIEFDSDQSPAMRESRILLAIQE